MVLHDIGEELRAWAVLRVAGREMTLGVDGDPRPAEALFEIVGRAEILPVIGTDVDEEAVTAVVEEVPDHQFFIEL
jgi:hypothetical protein